MKVRPALLFALAVVFLWTPTGSSAQAASRQPSSSAVSLDVVVTNKSGVPVADLQAGDFKLFDKKKEQSLISVEATGGASSRVDPPAEVILVVDAVNGSLETVASERQMLSRFLQENSGKLTLPTSVAVLSDQGMAMKSPPTLEGKELADFLNANIPGLRPLSTFGWDADMAREQLSLKALDFLVAQAGRRPGRKLLIWLSPGWRLQTSGNWVANQKDREMLFNKVVELSTELRMARVTVYSLDPSGIDSQLTFQQIYEAYLKGVDAPNYVDYGYLLLQVLATQTGGKALSASSDLAGLLHKCMEDAQGYYVLTFSAVPSTHANEYHTIEVQVDRPGLKARTRTGYYAWAAAPENRSTPSTPAQAPTN